MKVFYEFYGLVGWLLVGVAEKEKSEWGVERSIRGSQGSILGAGVTEFSETNTSNLAWLL